MTSALDKLAEDVGEDRVCRVLVEIGARGALRSFERRCAQRMVSRLYAGHLDRALIVKRLQSRYGFAKSTAYEIFTEVVDSENSRESGNCRTTMDESTGIRAQNERQDNT